MAPLITNGVECGVAFRTLGGTAEAGDQHAVVTTADHVVVAAIDGIGHGEEAARVSTMAAKCIEQSAAQQEHILDIMRKCHECLRGTRGAVMSLATLNVKRNLLTWLGVGNVEGILIRGGNQLAQERLLCRAGILGAALPPLQAAVLPIEAGDTIALATDGIQSGFERLLNTGDAPQANADRILSQAAKETDDALVLVARYVGER